MHESTTSTSATLETVSGSPAAGSAAGRPGSAEAEHRFHHYTSNAIPWYVRLIWVGFWIFAVAYTIRFLFPAMQIELIQRP
jgi:hypothetical protein